MSLGIGRIKEDVAQRLPDLQTLRIGITETPLKGKVRIDVAAQTRLTPLHLQEHAANRRHEQHGVEQQQQDQPSLDGQ